MKTLFNAKGYWIAIGLILLLACDWFIRITPPENEGRQSLLTSFERTEMAQPSEAMNTKFSELLAELYQVDPETLERLSDVPDSGSESSSSEVNRLQAEQYEYRLKGTFLAEPAFAILTQHQLEAQGETPLKVSEGELIGDFTLLQIEPSSITLKGPLNQEIRLRLYKGDAFNRLTSVTDDDKN